MKQLDEHIIEWYIRFRGTLSAAEKEEIEKGLKQSAEARALYDFLKTYYEQLDQTRGKQVTTYPLHYREKSAPKGLTVLAASTAGNTGELVTKATLVSEVNKTIVRVLQNQDDDTLQFHVIGEHPAQSSYAILSLNEPEVDLVTNKYGKLKGVREVSDIHWNEISSLLRLPVHKTEIYATENAHEFYSEIDEKTGVSLTISAKDISVKFIPEHHKISRILVVGEADSNLYKVNDKQVWLKRPPADMCSIYFYN